MKNLLFLLMAVTLLSIATSCDVLKQSVSTATELYVGNLQGQPVRFEDKAGYLQHFIEMKAEGFYAEHIKHVTFTPVKDFYPDINASNTLTAPAPFIETSDGRKLYWIDLFDESGQLKIKSYTRELH